MDRTVKRSEQTKWAELLLVKVDRSLAVPVARQISRQLRQAILTGTLAANSRLPSSRQLSERLKVSRTSVVAAYEALFSEGFLEGRRGSGTFIAPHLPRFDVPGPDAPGSPDAAASPDAPGSPGRAPAGGSPSLRRVSDAARRFEAAIQDELPRIARPFSPGRCAVDLPTIEAWRQITARTTRSVSPDLLGYGNPLGEEPLRQIVAEYLRAFRSVVCTAEQVIITSGAQQAIDLSIRILLNPGDPAWIEDPGYPAVHHALSAAQVITIPVAVDEGGLRVDLGIEREAAPRAIFVTPSHQYPTGAVMPVDRRLALLDAASRADAWIIEDDYDSEFRYSGHPLPSLQGLDPSGRVIYVGTLSKVLFPGLRVGFMVVPVDLVPACRGARYLTDRGPPTACQEVLEAFMREGFFTSHIRRMRQRYRSILDELLPCLRDAVGPYATLAMPECGMRLVAYLADGIDDRDVAREALRRGVIVRPISPLYLEAGARSGLDIGFTGHDRKLMQVAAVRLGEAIRQVASAPGA